MKDDAFERLLQNAAYNFGESYIDTSDLLYEPHEFSGRFEKKIHKLIKKQRRFYFPLVKTPLRLSFTIIAMVILMTVTMVMSVGALRERVFYFFANWGQKMSTVYVPLDKQHPLTIEEKYDITYDLGDFELEHQNNDTNCIDRIYGHGDDYIYFEQYTQEYFNGIMLNTEDAIAEDTEINGFPATFWFDLYGSPHITWDNGEYIFIISTTLSKEEAFAMAVSVMPTEKYVKEKIPPVKGHDIYDMEYMQDKQKLSFVDVWYDDFSIERDYNCGDYFIKLSQSKKEDYHYENINYWKTPETLVKINDIDGYFFYNDPNNTDESDINNSKTIYWENDKYVFVFEGNCPKEEAIKFAESVNMSE